MRIYKAEVEVLELLMDYLPGVLGIIVVDLVLSGDNAIVIGMAARRLPHRQRRLAILLGGAGAIGLRVLFAAIAALLLQIPFLQAAGGVLLLWIAWKLLRQEREPHDVVESVSLIGALQTIIIADVVMSLDNILAIAGVSHGSIALLLFGLMLSMPLILFGSGLIATIMDRLPALALVGAGILAWTAGKMVVDDPIVGQALPDAAALHQIVPLALTLAVLAPSLWGMLLSGRGAARPAAGITDGLRLVQAPAAAESAGRGRDGEMRSSN